MIARDEQWSPDFTENIEDGRCVLRFSGNLTLARRLASSAEQLDG